MSRLPVHFVFIHMVAFLQSRPPPPGGGGHIHDRAPLCSSYLQNAYKALIADLKEVFIAGGALPGTSAECLLAISLFTLIKSVYVVFLAYV